MVTVSNSTLSANSASNGGGIYNGATLTVTASTLSGNSAVDGGGIDIFAGVAHIQNTIVAGNTAGSRPDLDGASDSLGHNLIGDGTGGSGFTDTDLVGTAANPIDPLLGPLQDNGGPTQTMALLSDSPAIDAGDNAGASQWDQRGPNFRRIVNYTTDIGAFEIQSIESPIQGGFDALALPPCHGCSSDAVPLGFTFDFFGQPFKAVWVNNNGNLTFDGPFAGAVPGRWRWWAIPSWPPSGRMLSRRLPAAAALPMARARWMATRRSAPPGRVSPASNRRGC